jgi:hypothetical protein
LTLAATAVAAAGARADVIIRAGPVLIRVGRTPAPVPAQPATLPAQPAPAPPVEVQPPPGVPLEIAPPAAPVPRPGDSAPGPAARPLTVREFAGSFRPTCGTHTVVLVHPFTGRPVEVCFTLPADGVNVKVKRGLRERIEFSYGRKRGVEIVFLRNGAVKVSR